MKILPTVLILLLGIASVFAQASLMWPRRLLDTQVDLLPALMVVTALRLGLPSVVLLSLVGGMSFDSLSLNRLGVTTLPLGLLGVGLHLRREHILRDTPFAQACLGAMAGVVVPVSSLLLTLTTGDSPLLGAGLVWNLVVLGALNALATPVAYELTQWLDDVFTYKSPQQPSFRPDREIRRGRF
jgi:hypothetical protein